MLNEIYTQRLAAAEEAARHVPDGIAITFWEDGEILELVATKITASGELGGAFQTSRAHVASGQVNLLDAIKRLVQGIEAAEIGKV
jgi:hypothetical protein